MRASESPTAAQRTPPRWIGPVGLAETNSRFTFSPAAQPPFPYAGPASTIVRASSPADAASSMTLRNPGPATSTLLTPGTSASRAASTVATCRGGRPAPLASCRATLVDQSPWSRLRGRSTVTVSGTATASSPAATASARAPRTARDRSSGVTLEVYRRAEPGSPSRLGAGSAQRAAGCTRLVDPSARGQDADDGDQLVRVER